MKKFILQLIRNFGYEIISYNPKKGRASREFLDEKNKALIKEISSLYQEFLFPEFPNGNSRRVDLIAELIGTQTSEAIYIIHYLNKAINIEGDICEFGIAQGTTSALLANEIINTSKSMWLFDSFKGLPKPTEKDLLKEDIFNLGSIAAYEGTMKFNINLVKERLSEIEFPFSRVKIIPGFIEKTIKMPNLPELVSFAYVDFDFYEPVKIALEFLDNHLAVGGYVIVDDYDFFSTGVKTAVEEFLKNKKYKFTISLPCKSAGNFCILERNE